MGRKSKINDCYINTNGYHIPLRHISDKDLKSLKEKLTIVPVDTGYGAVQTKKPDGKPEIKHKLYVVTKNHISVPRYYGIKKYGDAELKFKPKKVKIKFTGELRDYQRDIIEKSLSHVKKKGGGLLVVPCGFGKTTMAIYIASILGLKTLIITHKTFLQDQWIERCKQFTKSGIGIIRQKTVYVDGKDFVV